MKSPIYIDLFLVSGLSPSGLSRTTEPRDEISMLSVFN